MISTRVETQGVVGEIFHEFASCPQGRFVDQIEILMLHTYAGTFDFGEFKAQNVNHDCWQHHRFVEST
jgi:hypothetical protein